jgi:hypothetical protein
MGDTTGVKVFAGADGAGTSFRAAPEGNSKHMFPAENLRDWRGEKVIDPEGSKIGELEAVYVDTATDQPAFATVRVGIIGRHRLAFVPLDGATVSPTAVRVRYDKKLVGDAPGIDTDGELTAADEPKVFAHYAVPYQPGSGGERRLARR